jgi:hypothetical protein
MNIWTRLAVLLLVMGWSPAWADEGSPAADAAEVAGGPIGFLKPGRDYVIRFAPGSDLFKTTRSGLSETSYTTSDGETRLGKPATWTMTLNVTIFEVLRVGSGSWVLVRHPADSDDFAAWTGQRRAKAILASPRRDEIAAGPDGMERLAKLQEAAEREIKTTETWLNLDHAVTISDVPVEAVELKVSVKPAEKAP